MEYRMLLGMDSIIRYGDIRGPAPLKRYRYTLKVEQQLINHIHMGNFDEAQVILDNVVWSGLTDKDISVNMARCLMFDLVGTMLKAIDEIHLNSEDTYFDSVKPVDMLMRCKTIDELKRNFTSFLEDVCREVADHKKQQTSEMNGAVKSYVEEQYRDKNLSVSSIAEWFHRNPVYLSRVFKEETGCGLAEYIAMVRMEHAKRLLSEEHRSVKSVAHDVGFPDSAAFIRMFKRTAGITPGQYKDM
jgi:YesN/AraC family two-component response regulator